MRTDPPFTVSIVIVTFNREHLLKQLIESISAMSPKPERVVVVNNASTDGTAEVIDNWANSSGDLRIQAIHLAENTGGAGGFKTGILAAKNHDENWFWLMDDDVVVLPDALSRASRWSDGSDAFMGQRLNSDGSIVHWSPTLSSSTGLAPLVFRDPLRNQDQVASNSGCFEGMFISKQVVETVGLPDSRFFITWDDAVFGWLISRSFRVSYVRDIFLKRTIEMKSLGPKSFTVFARNNLGRYYFIRNRAIQAKYFSEYGVLNQFAFEIGTIRVIAIEVIRSIFVERNFRGLAHIVRGAIDYKALLRDSSFAVPEQGS